VAWLSPYGGFPTPLPQVQLLPLCNGRHLQLLHDVRGNAPSKAGGNEEGLAGGKARHIRHLDATMHLNLQFKRELNHRVKKMQNQELKRTTKGSQVENIKTGVTSGHRECSPIGYSTSMNALLGQVRICSWQQRSMASLVAEDSWYFAKTTYTSLKASFQKGEALEKNG